MSLDVCDAMTQGQMGYMIEQTLRHNFTKKGIKKSVITLVTQEVVSEDDPAFWNSTNFIVPFFKKDESIELEGGGNLMLRDKKGRLKGAAAVIDKDFAAERIASLIGAEMLLLITPVKQVAIFYGTSKQRNLKSMTLKEAKRYFAEGHFPPGSMGPKIEAAIKFLDSGGKRTIITSLEGIDAAIKGEGGTEIIP